MKLDRFSPFEIRVAQAQGRILRLVPTNEVLVTGRVDAHKLIPITVEWPSGPQGHAIVGICPDGCHYIAELPRMWRRRGREVRELIGDPGPDHPCAGGCACESLEDLGEPGDVGK